MKSLIEILVETIHSKTPNHLLESPESKHNPMESGEEINTDLGKNHYLNDTPDEGWEYFWESWENLSDDEFNTEFGKSKEDYKTIFENEIISAKKKAVAYYKDYYSDKNPDVVNKFKKRGIFSLPIDTLKILHKRLDKIGASDKRHEIYYTTKGMKRANPITNMFSGSLKGAWGFAKPWKNKVYINLHQFSNPNVGGWQDSIYNTMVHEIGHVISFILFKWGKRPYKKIKVDNIFDKKDKKDPGVKYILTDAESYARVQQLRRALGVTTNLTTTEWVTLWMEAVNNGDIKFVDKVYRIKENQKAPEGVTDEQWKKIEGKKGCAPLTKDNTYEEILNSENPKWYDQVEQVTIEVSEDYSIYCVCQKTYTKKSCVETGADIKFTSRNHLWTLYQGLEYFGQDFHDIGALLAKFTSKYSKKGGKHYLTIDFSKIAQANEEWAAREQEIGGEDTDSALV